MNPVARPSVPPARAPRARRLPAALAAALLLVPTAVAQGSGADLATGYRAVSGALESARLRLAADPQGARAQVEIARNGLRALAPAIRSQRLNDGAKAALDAAATAVQRGSAADLVAQSTQVRSVLQRALYDSLFAELAAGRAELARRRATALASAVGLPVAGRERLVAAAGGLDADRARAEIETHLAAAMRNALGRARDQAADRPTAFQSAVRASGAFLVVQDSPRAGDLSVRAFSDALALLAKGDAAGFRASVDGLLAATDRFAAAARATLVALPAAGGPPAAAPAASAPARTASAPARAADPAAVPSSPSVPAAPAPAPAAEALRASLVRAGVPAAAAGRLAASLSSQGFASVDVALDRVRARLGEALALAQNARIPAARERLDAARATFGTAVRPVVEAVDPALAARAARAFDATGSGVSGLRAADLGVLLGEVQAAAERLTGAAGPGGLQGAAAAVQPAWAGLLRGPVFLIVALLFAYPMYLMNLAFGGRNPFWRYIGIAMVLLFVAPFLEGAAWLGSVLAQGTGVVWFDTWANLSVLSSPLAQLVWAVLLAATLVFATAGFRGIAMQFGLIRSRNQPAGTATGLEPARAGASTGEKPAETIVEWDEEF